LRQPEVCPKDHPASVESTEYVNAIHHVLEQVFFDHFGNREERHISNEFEVKEQS